MSTIVMTLGRGINKIDNAVLAIILIGISIAFGLPGDDALESLRFTTSSLLGISPFLIASAAAAAYLSAAGADKMIGRVFSGHGIKVIAAAALFGALSPFCSCGVIPIIAALLAAGVPLPAVMAFWLSSPIMDPEMFVLTVGGLNFEFAVAKTIAAFAIGIFGGLATRAVQRSGGFASPLKAEVAGCGSSCKPQISDEKPLWAFWKEAERKQEFGSIFTVTVLFLGKWLLLAFMLESLMVMYLPADTVAQWLGNDSTFALPLAVIAGVPAYMNGYAAIPLVAGLMDSGMAPGPALAFMTAGAVTSIPAAIAVFALVRRPVFLWYLLLAAVGSLAVGQVFQVYMGL
ncbi:MAG: permease [Rhodospirillaceae bacterium]|nr:permease [Rhodospirillaceae bacterium]